jgi:predicted DNA-binding transcriptional regulator YafY
MAHSLSLLPSTISSMKQEGFLSSPLTLSEARGSAARVRVAQPVSVKPRRTMTKTARVYKIEMLIRNRGHVSFQAMLDELEVSPATLKRDLDYLKDQLGAPIEYDRSLNGYKFGQEFRGQKHELPGLWFSEREIYALLTMHQLIQGLDDEGVLGRHLMPVLDKLHGMLGESESETKQLVKRVKILSAAKRPVPSKYFELLGGALVKRLRVQMRYFSRGRKVLSDRLISPQRLVHYRNTWYLDAWCHTAEELRRFSLDAIEHAEVVPHRAKDVALKAIEAEFDRGYGAFSGNELQWATIVFDADAAQWVSKEIWHPEQKGTPLPDGRFRLEVPYADPTELAMDVMRLADHLEVESPETLKLLVASKVQAAARGLAR